MQHRLRHSGAIGNRIGSTMGGQPWEPPFRSDTLFYLDGTIISSGGNYYFKDRSSHARNFLITGYDFDSTLDKGFPYKSTATISAPAGDATLIAADLNSYLYTAGTPNAISVVSLFQDVDYEHKLFCRHAAQVVDGNLVETYEPRVLEVVMYNTVKSGADLTTCQTYFGVPTEVVTNAKWVDTVNGSDVAPNDGTKAKPYKTFAKAITGVTTTGTIYVKTGDLNIACTITNKGLNIIGVGYTRNSLAGGIPFSITNNTTDTNTIKGFVCTGASTYGIRINATTGGVVVQSNKITSPYPVYSSTDNTTASYLAKYNIFTGQHFVFYNSITLDTNYFGVYTIPVRLRGGNLVSKNNIYKGSATTLIQRIAATTSISLLGDNLTGSLFTDEAIATVTTITVNRCKVYSTNAGVCASLVNAASKVSFVITNNLITIKAATSSFNLKGYDITFDSNIVVGANDYIIIATALAAAKTFTFSNNICSSAGQNGVSSFDYIFNAFNNIMVSGSTTNIKATSVNQSNIPASIHDNYMVSKSDGNPFILLGTEYSLTIDGRMNGSEVYNNRFSGAIDWGVSPGSTHGLFTWNQQVNWHHNYLSGTFLGFVLKSNGGTFANAIHHNIIKDCSMSFTIKGIKGTLIYNNTCINAVGYNGLAETNPGTTGDSGNTVMKNNIIYDADSTTYPVQINDAANAVGCVFENNVYWFPNSTKVGAILPTTYTLAQWRLLGYDLLTVVQNPNLNTSGVPVPKIEDAEDLGVSYDDGLDASTDWGNETTLPVVVTKQQPATWQNGAFVQ